MALTLSDFENLSSELNKALEWRRTIYISDVFEHYDGGDAFTIGYGPGPHYEETLATFHIMNGNEAELIAKALQFFVNYHQQLLHLCKVGDAVEGQYKAQKEQIISEMLASQRDLLDKIL